MINPGMQKVIMLVICFLFSVCACQSPKHALEGGLINKSRIYQGGLYHVNTDSLSGQPFITISEDNIEIDFNQTFIDGRKEGSFPDTYSGIAIHIKDCKNVTIKNVNIRGFKIAILAEHVDNLKILSSNVSYNYRPELRSRWDREALSDWLYFHHNENDEWKEYGAALYLKGCKNALIKDIICHQGFNGLLMVQCEGALVYNNDISYNSGLGIGMYRSSHNRIMHNKLDWNARGYSYGKYARGQDSSAILLYEQSSHNIFAYNSGTHSGDGLFLWAGQHTMDTGQGGCDSNIIYRNDFSHSIANAIEVTFSANYMVENVLNDSRYGVWGGYSHHSVIRGNEIKSCETGIAIEHGRFNVIKANHISDGKTGIQLWARSSQPPDWPYAQKLDVSSRQYIAAQNQFKNLHSAFNLSLTDSVWIDDNIYTGVEYKISPPSGAGSFFTGHEHEPAMDMQFNLPEPMPDGHEIILPPGTLRGRKYIIINEWGPYDFKYPTLALRKKELIEGMEELHFDIYGPNGTWSIDSITGCDSPDHRSGTTPDSLIIRCDKVNGIRYIDLTFNGDQVVTQFGDTVAAGTVYPFQYTETIFTMDWKVSFFKYDSLSDPLRFPEAFHTLLNGSPLKIISTPELTYRWWNAPDADIPADRFAIRATTMINNLQGKYMMEVESDDGIRIWLDGKIILERWDIHTPTMDEVKFTITEGPHELIVDYFEGGGLGVLDVTLLHDE